MTALLASSGRARRERRHRPEFTRAGGPKLAAHGIRNVTLETGDAARGWDRHGPYDAILLTGSVPLLAEISRRA